MGEEKNVKETKDQELNKVEEEKAKEEDKNSEGEKDKNNEKGGDAGDKKPPPEVVLRVFMHCEGCARKVRRCLKGFEGVEDVTTDCKTHKVVVKGKKAAEDPIKVVERVQRKSGRKVELLSPPPQSSPEKKEEKPMLEDRSEPVVITVVLKVHMHCEACGQEIKKRILKMKGVQSVDADLKVSQVAVNGVFDPTKLVEYVYKRSGKHAVILKQYPPEKMADDVSAAGGGDDAKPQEGGGGGEKPESESMEKADGESESAGGEDKKDSADDATKLVELRRGELLHYHQRYPVEYVVYPPQIFSDENPNACSVM